MLLDETGRVREIRGARVEDVLRAHAEIDKVTREQANTNTVVGGATHNLVQAGVINGDVNILGDAPAPVPFFVSFARRFKITIVGWRTKLRIGNTGTG
jgi:hypothetical protein